MRVVVTGAAGFVGRQVVHALIAQRGLVDGAGARRPIGRLVLADVVPVPSALLDAAAAAGIDARVAAGDVRDAAFLPSLVADGVDSVFHLAATLTMQAETDFALGLDVNVHALMRLLEACRTRARAPKLVYASSIAAFGGRLPKVVDDDLVQTPQTSYGTHKAIAELLINDYARHGFVDGRALRLPVVMIRPGAPTPAVSDRIAAIVREPLMGHDVVCPLAERTRMPLASVRRVADGLLRIHDLPPDAFGFTRAMNLPSLTASVADLIGALHRVGAGRRLGAVRVEPDPALQAVVDGWPQAFVSARASRHGLGADADVDAILRAFIEDVLS